MRASHGTRAHTLCAGNVRQMRKGPNGHPADTCRQAALSRQASAWARRSSLSQQQGPAGMPPPAPHLGTRARTHTHVHAQEPPNTRPHTNNSSIWRQGASRPPPPLPPAAERPPRPPCPAPPHLAPACRAPRQQGHQQVQVRGNGRAPRVGAVDSIHQAGAGAGAGAWTRAWGARPRLAAAPGSGGRRPAGRLCYDGAACGWPRGSHTRGAISAVVHVDCAGPACRRRGTGRMCTSC